MQSVTKIENLRESFAEEALRSAVGAPILPAVYRSMMANEEFVCKTDLFAFIKKWVFTNHNEVNVAYAKCAVMLFERLKEKELSSYAEFVPINDKRVNVNSRSKDERVYHVDGLGAVLDHFATLFPGCEPEEFQMVSGVLSYCYQTEGSFDSRQFMETYYYLHDLFESIERLVQMRREIFCPFEPKKNNELPLTLRVFEDNKRHFLMASEFVRVVSIKRGEEPTEERSLSIVEFDHLFLKHFPEVELIVTPIKRENNAAVTTLSSFGMPCILAADVLIQIVKSLIFGHKVFQKIQKSEWPVVEELLNTLAETFFLCNHPDAYFLEQEDSSTANELVYNYLYKYIDRSAEDFRSVGSNGFTMRDLTDELNRLGLVNLFPEITDYVRFAYTQAMKNKKNRFLLKLDLVDAVEHCQLLCLFNRFPNLVKFLHVHKSCDFLDGLRCPHCDEKKPVRKVKAAKQRLLKRKEEEHNVLKTKRTKKVERPVEQSEQVEKDPSPTSPDQKQKTPESVEAAPALPPPKSPQQPESKVCEKCKRTSDRCEKVKEKLKKSEKNNEELKTALRKTERELQEKDQKLEEMEKKMREMEEKLAAQTEMVQEAEKLKGPMEKMKVTNVQQLQKKMKRQEEKIKMLNLETTAFSIKCLKNQQLIDRLLAERDATSESPKGPELTEEMKEMLHELEEKIAELKEMDPVGKATEKCKLLESQAEKDALKKLAAEELKTFEARHEEYKRVLQENIKMIKEMRCVARGQLPVLPQLPSLSAEFTKAYERAMFESYLEECPVCLERMDPTTMKLVKCTTCRKTFQEDCVEKWHQSRGETCPNCRGSILDFVELPLAK
ncbi:unnamed protein product [Caenorhabditis sp. 36 PRJEB53466]|nr:unnamed protein product [Caenorhabditis sp. 36 PRJEB53466]